MALKMCLSHYSVELPFHPGASLYAAAAAMLRHPCPEYMYIDACEGSGSPAGPPTRMPIPLPPPPFPLMKGQKTMVSMFKQRPAVRRRVQHTHGRSQDAPRHGRYDASEHASVSLLPQRPHLLGGASGRGRHVWAVAVGDRIAGCSRRFPRPATAQRAAPLAPSWRRLGRPPMPSQAHTAVGSTAPSGSAPWRVGACMALSVPGPPCPAGGRLPPPIKSAFKFFDYIIVVRMLQIHVMGYRQGLIIRRQWNE